MTEAERQYLQRLLRLVERELDALGYLGSRPPAPEAFHSEVPFFADTMVFTDWLQWVFVARFRAILEGGHSLPANCAVAPMAEEALSGLEEDTEPLTEVLREIDALFE